MVTLFGKKEEKKVGRGFVPIERVKEMLDKGFNEIEIIDTLRKEGFSAEEIDKALTEAYKDVISRPLQPSTEQTTNTQPPQIQAQYQPFQNISAPLKDEGLSKEIKPLAQTQTQQTFYQPFKSEIETKLEDQISLEEYLDALIKSNLDELNKRLMEISLKQRELEEKIADFENKLAETEKSRKDELEKILLEIRGSRENINDLIVKVETLSKTIKELLPTLIEAVRLLSEIVQQKTK
ncbi:MAG: hypothetical protein QXQ14_00930 [Candidatus Aenigmatarchaeota archaeon]